MGSWLNHLPTAALVLTTDGRAREWNVDAAALLGWSAQADTPYLARPDARWLRRLFDDAAAGDSARVVITRRAGGRRRALELRARHHDNDSLVVLLRDCTQQLAGRRIRSAQEHRLRRFLDRLPEAALIEQQGRVVYANEAAARLLAYEPGELGDMHVGSLLDAATLKQIERLLLDDGVTAVEPITVNAHRANGASIAVQIAALPLQYRRQPAVQLLLRDLSAQRQAEAGLRAMHERLRLISDTVRDHAILTVDHEGRVTSWNAGAERLTGYTAEDMIRAPFSVLHGGSAEEAAELFETEYPAGRLEQDTVLRRRDGSELHAQLTITPLSEAGDHVVGYAVIVRDLTERKLAEESLRRSEEQLRHSQKMDAIGRLAAGIAHDFNNILTAIQGHVQFLLEDLPEDLECRDDAAEIQKAAARATELTRQLLTFARKQPTRPTLLNVNAVTEDLEKLLRRLLPASVALDTSYGEVAEVFIDPGQIEQVLVNLVVNARDAMQDGGRITLSTARISLDEMYSARGLSLAPGEYVQITVSDTGIGMSAEMQRQIFEPFFTTKAEGTGLGLPTVYGIVTQASGHISVYSEVGMGTTFKVFLPAQPGQAAAVRSPADSATGTVLLVEDDIAVRALARRTLVSAGFDVVEASDGMEALRIAEERTGSIDVMVTDLTMPRLSGEELASRIRDSQPQAGVVLMSGFPEMSLQAEGRLDGQQRFLEKPFTPASLTNAVRDAMRSMNGESR